MSVVDHAMGRQATNEANIALKEVLGKLYDSLDLAAEAWSDIVVPIAEKYNTEMRQSSSNEARSSFLVVPTVTA
jgi:hypothetical protein